MRSLKALRPPPGPGRGRSAACARLRITMGRGIEGGGLPSLDVTTCHLRMQYNTMITLAMQPTSMLGYPPSHCLGPSSNRESRRFASTLDAELYAFCMPELWLQSSACSARRTRRASETSPARTSEVLVMTNEKYGRQCKCMPVKETTYDGEKKLLFRRATRLLI